MCKIVCVSVRVCVCECGCVGDYNCIYVVQSSQCICLFVLSVDNHCAYHVYKLIALHVVCADSL